MSDTETKAPTLSDVFQQLYGRAGSGIRVCVPGTIKTLRGGGKADIEVAVKGLRNGEVQAEPTLLDVPVLGLGSQRAAIFAPILPGDPGLLVFADRDIDRWKAALGLLTTNASTPRIHDLSDCVFVPITVGSQTAVELWSALALVVSALSTSVGVPIGAPQTFAPAMALLLTRLLAAGIIPG